MLFSYLALIETEEDELTFLHIYEHYGRQMYHLAMGILRKHEAAEDAVQNALLGIATSIDRVPTDSETAIKAYVFTAVRNAALTLAKEEQKWEELTDISGLAAAAKTDVFRTLAAAEDYDMLLKLMGRLPLQYREVLFLRYVMELTPKEIGATLHRKTTTVQQQLARAKQILAALYTQEVAGNA